MKRVAFVTCESHSALRANNIAEDDLLAMPALAAHDVKVVPWIWTGEAPRSVDLAIIRSPWDWTANARGFDDFLAKLEESGTPFENQNARKWQDKTYLERLAKNGARTIPSRFVRPGEPFEDAVRSSGWSELVMKPSLSAGGRRTVRFLASDLEKHDALAKEILASGTLLLQPFFREIIDHGEWSLVFFSSEYSHALKKHPATGDFRVQDDFGGTVKPAIAPDDVIRDARKVIEAAAEEFLFARVDGLVSEAHGGFLVTELEVVEPELFLRADAQAPERFANAIERRLARPR